MAQLPLPYPDYSWSLTQHIGPVTEARTLYEILQAAYVYGDEKNSGDLITQYIVQQELLTPNLRRDTGRENAWRDYQQVLPELGLIVSTRFTKGVSVTTAGLMLLDGIVGFSELMTTQALRYQYPNGQKQSQMELDVNYGVLIKPAVLILRVLLELHNRQNEVATLTVSECVEALVPIKSNSQWQIAVGHLLDIRKQKAKLVTHTDGRSRRHVQEWFRFLNLSDIFHVSKHIISLTPLAEENIDLLYALCEYHEAASTFWILPQGDRNQIGFSWFRHYGNPEILSQWVVPTLPTEEYVEANYIGGTEEHEQIGTHREKDFQIRLQDFSLEIGSQLPLIPRPSVFDPERFAQGQAQRHRSARLHDEIVAIVARRLAEAGYQVAEDPTSVDLLASKENAETIVEVKTVNRRNVDVRMRLGVGQLSEYRYRRQLQTNRRPSGILVLSSSTGFVDWLIDYFKTDIKLGLVALDSSDTFSAYTDGEIETILSN